MTPTQLERTPDNGLLIQWSAGAATKLTTAELRAACPCATCREKHSAEPKEKQKAILPVLSLEEARPLTIEGMRPVGNYAYNIAFSDGHDSGIYTFEFLHSLGADSDT